MRFQVLLVLAVGLLSACSAEKPRGDATARPASDPLATAEAFYAAYFALPPGGGIPDEAGRAKLAPYFAPELNKLLADAAAAEERHRQATNNQEPPLIEGDPFTSMFEGATELVGRPACALADAPGDTATCHVDLAYKDSSGTSQWRDRLHLRKTSAWLIEDISHGGAGAFNPKGRLTDLLKGVIAEAPK